MRPSEDHCQFSPPPSTTRDSRSQHGRPVCVDAFGELVPDRDFLRHFFEVHSYSQREFSRLLGCSPRAVRSWISGWRSAPTEALNVMRDVLEHERQVLLKKRLAIAGEEVGARS